MDWNPEDCNPLADLAEYVEKVGRDIGYTRPMSFQEVLHHDVQTLYLMGWNSEQVIGYVKWIKAKLAEFCQGELTAST